MKIAAAVVALVVVGALEARESAQQIADATGPLRPSPSGVGLTALGLVVSVAIYVALGWSLDDRDALRRGALVGVIAGTIGGAVRAVIISGVVADAISRYALVPGWFVPGVLTLFVAGSALVSAAGGAALCFAAIRIRRATSRGASSRPPA